MASALAHLGHEVHLVNTKATLSQVNIPSDLPYTQHWATFPGFKDKRNALFRARSSKSVKNIVASLLQKNSQLDQVVHSNGEEGADLFRLKDKFDFKLVCSVRYSSLPNRMKKTGRTLHDQLLLRFSHHKLLKQERTATYADVICTPSLFSAEMIKAHFQHIPRVEVVHNGIPVEFLHFERSLPIVQEEAPILYFGRLSHDKGLHTLFKAFHLFNKDFSNPLLIIGDGPELPRLKDLAKQLELTEQISFLGWKTHEEIGHILCSSLMAVFPSEHEAFGLSLLSAMACGVPTIGSATGGITEIIDSSEVGLLCKVNDYKHCYEQMKRLRIDPEVNSILGKRAMKHAREHFQWKNSATQLVQKVYS